MSLCKLCSLPADHKIHSIRILPEFEDVVQILSDDIYDVPRGQLDAAIHKHIRVADFAFYGEVEEKMNEMEIMRYVHLNEIVSGVKDLTKEEMESISLEIVSLNEVLNADLDGAELSDVWRALDEHESKMSELRSKLARLDNTIRIREMEMRPYLLYRE